MRINLTLLCFASLSGLSVDYAANKLYWISSANNTINRCNLDGTGLEVLESFKRDLTKGTALAVMGEFLTFGLDRLKRAMLAGNAVLLFIMLLRSLSC